MMNWSKIIEGTLPAVGVLIVTGLAALWVWYGEVNAKQAAFSETQRSFERALETMRAETREEFKEVRAENERFRNEVREEFKEVREENERFRSEVREEFKVLHAKLDRVLLATRDGG